MLLSGVNTMCYDIIEVVFGRLHTTCKSCEDTNSLCHDQSGISAVSVNNVSSNMRVLIMSTLRIAFLLVL